VEGPRAACSDGVATASADHGVAAPPHHAVPTPTAFVSTCAPGGGGDGGAWPVLGGGDGGD
jgi:hypothetical protein